MSIVAPLLIRSPVLTVPDVGTSSRDCFAATMAAPLRASSVGKAELALPDIFRLAHVHHPGCADADANPVRVIGVPGGNGSASPSTLDAFGDAVGAVAAALSSELRTAPVVGLGQGAGGYALALAASRKRAVLKGLVLVSPLSRSAGWTETFNVRTTAASLSYRGGASNGVVNYVASRIFGHIALGGGGPGSDCARAYRQRLAEHLNGSSDARAALSASLSMLASRPNLVERGDVGRIACRTLSHLSRGVRGTLAGTLEPGATGTEPADWVTLHVGDRHQSVIKRGAYVGDTVRHIL